MATISYRPIGVVHSPFADIERMPIQPGGRTAAPGTVEIFGEYEDGLRDLDGFSHVILLVHLHQAPAPRLTVAPFPDSEPHGIFV